MDGITSDFVIDSKERCFFCMDNTSSPQTRIGDEECKLGLAAVHSLQYLSRFLRMDMKNVFTEEGDIPPHLMAKVEMSRLKAHLCPSCASLNETFSKLCRRLEKIEMDVLSSLENIYSCLRQTQNLNERNQLANPMEVSEKDLMAKLGILEVVREEAIKKCSIKLRNSRLPLVKISNLSKSKIMKIKHSKTQRSIETSNTSFAPSIKIELELDDIILHQPSNDQEEEHQSESEIDRESTPSSPSLEEAILMKCEEDNGSPSGSTQGQLRARIDENMEKIQLPSKQSGRQKYRCRLCGKVLSKRSHATRHIKIVHLKEKQYSCPQCSNEFSLKHNLERHMLIHSGFKPCKCHFCPKQFRRSQYLKAHLLAHAGIRPFKCNWCNNAYSHKSTLIRHQRTIHEGY